MQFITPFFYQFWHNFKTVFRLRNLPWHVLAILLTYVIVRSGFDQYYFAHSRLSIIFTLLIPSALLGFILPILIPLFFLINQKTRNLGYALGQSAFLGWLISSLYKAVTGRVHPELFNGGSKMLIDLSREFHFGLLKGGIFWGWPSSHTTVAFAMAATTFILHPNPRVKVLAILLALYVGLGVSVTIHWFSDFVAGAIFGTLVGIIVGLAFRHKKS